MGQQLLGIAMMHMAKLGLVEVLGLEWMVGWVV
jgi:hypothetical protein